MTYPDIDPAAVRTIAETVLQSTDGGSPAERVESALIASGVAGPVVSERFDAWTVAVSAEYERLESERNSNFSPKAQADAIEHLLFKLNQIASDAGRTAESQEAAAEGTRNFSRQLRYEEAAEFQRALVTLTRQVAEDVQQKYGNA